MSGLNIEWAIDQLNRFIVLAKPGTQSVDARPMAQAVVIEKIFDRVLPNWRRAAQAGSTYDPWFAYRSMAVRAIEELERKDELSMILGDNAPTISASSLHPWIWDGARSLWQSGHYRSAVEDAAKKVNAETQNKVGRRDVSETDLFNQAFTLDPAKPGKPRLRRMQDDGSDTCRSVQRGAMTFAEGIFAGIRNPLSHETDQELSEQRALEYLAALSVLARWVDESKVERAGAA